MNTGRGNGLGNGESSEGCDLARAAMVRATDALDGNRNVYEALGGVVREMVGLRAEMREGFRSMGVRIRDARRDAREAHDAVEEFEDTKVRDLRAALKKAERAAAGWRAWGVRLLGGIIVGVVVTLIVSAIRAHK